MPFRDWSLITGRVGGYKMGGGACEETQGIRKFCQNTGKTQGIWFAQVVNSPIQIFAVNISKFFLKLD